MPYVVKIAILLCLTAAVAHGRVYYTRDEALLRVFGDTETVEKITLYLTREEAKRVAERARVKEVSRLFTYYRGVRNGKVTAYVTFVSHVVRTRYAVTMVVLNPDLSVKMVEVVAFYEPEEYLPDKRWFAQFRGKRLTNSLWPKRDIQTVTGATLSVNTIVRETRKVLALFETVLERERKR